MPVLRDKANGDAAIGPLHHGAFDGAGLGLQEGSGAGSVGDGRLVSRVQLAPGSTLAVEQFFPADGLLPAGDVRGAGRFFLEVVKLVVQPLICQPLAGLFHRGAVGDAVNVNTCTGSHVRDDVMLCWVTIAALMQSTTFSTLAQWLEHCERIHPENISLGLERVREVAQRLQLTMPCPVITVAGTNGKGSTCAMLEAVALQAGYRPGVYTSPHLVHFQERCRVHGEIVAPEDLLPHFAAVEAARLQGEEVLLTYFEFTTLAILRLLSQAKLDLAILEVGLGGRLDATNIIDADCAIITSVDVDHTAFLGSDRETIGREKAGIMRPDRPVVVSDPVPPQSVIDHARAIGADLWRFGEDFNYNGDPQQWAWAGRGRRYAGLSYPALRGANQLVNAAGVLAAFEALRDKVPVTAQAVRTGLAMVELPGRFQVLPGEPVLVLDVAHNPHSVAALAANLGSMGGAFPVTHAVFGAMADKDLAPMFTTISPLIDRWYFTDLPIARAAKALDLQQQWRSLEKNAAPEGAQPPDVVQPIVPSAGVRLSVHRNKQAQTPEALVVAAQKFSQVFAQPEQALQAALAAAGPADRIIVFGSFHTVGEVVKDGPPRLHAKHLG